MSCLLCQGKLDVAFNSRTDLSVSSDCRVVEGFPTIYICTECGHIQKLPDEEYRQTTQQLYESYTASCLTGEQEQLQFDGGIPAARTKLILNNIMPHLRKSPETWLDIGTGSGVMLSTVADQLPQTRLWGQDVSAHNKQKICRLASVEGFFSGDLSAISPHRFELVSAIHVLEHVENLQAFLSQVSQLLTESGVFLVQVPDVTANPFDVCVFDHISHFQRETMRLALSRHFDYVYLVKNQLTKEVTYLASNHLEAINVKGSYVAESQPLELGSLINLNQLLKSVNQPVAVFSTGPAGIYAAANLGKNLTCFVDEDPNKIGKYYLDVPIVSVENFASGKLIINPLPKMQRKIVSEKFPQLNFLEY